MQKKLFKIYIFFLLFLSAIISGYASPSYLSTPIRGLSSQICYDIIKSDGFIWIATRNGIDRYDGKDFNHYQLSDKSARTLSDGFVISLYQCPGGRHHIFAFSERNIIYRFNPVKNRFEEILDLSEFKGMGALQSIYSSNGSTTLMVGMSNGLAIFDLENKKLISHIAADCSIHAIIPYNLGHTNLVGTQKGLMVYDISKKTLKSVRNSPLDINCLHYDYRNKIIWIGTNGQGLWQMRNESLQPTQINGCSSSIITDITPLDDSNLLVATDGDGVYTVGKNLQLSLMASDLTISPNSIPARAIKDILVDEGHIWIAMYMGGVQLLSPIQPFSRIKNSISTVASDNYLFNADCDANGNIWTAFNQSLACYHADGSSPKFYMNGKAQLLAVEAMTDGTVWCGGYNSGLYHLWPKTGKIEHWTSVCGSKTNDCVYSLLEDANGNLWAGGLNMKLTCIQKDGNKQNYNINYIYDICNVNPNLIAVATCEGFYTVNTRTGTIKPYLVGNSRNGIIIKNENGNKEVCTATNYISSLTCRAGHEMWLATDGGGLICYNLKSDRICSFGLQNGLSSLNLRSVELLNDSILCVSTEENGLFSFNCHSRRCELNLQSADGLGINQFYQNSSCVTPNGKVVFGGNNGGIVLSADKFSAVRSDFSVRLICPADTSNGSVHLPYNNRSLTLQVTTTDIYHQNLYHFFYRIDGSDTTWHEVDESRTLHFLSLPSGSYKLQVKAVGADNKMEENFIYITADREPWLRWYAFALYFLVFGTFVYLLLYLYRYRMRQEQSDEKIRFFSNVAHDIRTPLALVAAPLYELENQAKDNESMQEQLSVMKRNVGHLTQIVDQLTAFNRFHEGKDPLNLISIHLQPLLDNIRQSYEPLAQRNGLEFKLEMPLQEVWVKTDTRHLGRVLDNLIGNAFKYTPKGSISVRLTSSASEARIEVNDTGLGMSEESQSKLFKQFFRGENVSNSSIPGCGVGLLFSYQLVKRMGGDLTCNSELGTGSSFILSLPVSETGVEQGENLYTINSTDYLSLSNHQSDHLNFNGLRYSILVVEDNVDLQKYLSKALHERYNVFNAGCVNEAMQIMTENNIDLIISDIMMPGMRGDDWCAKLKNDIATSHIPVILLTALADVTTQIKGLGFGADDYITKPFNMNVLLLKVGNIFQQRKRMHAYYINALHLSPASADSNQKEDKTDNQIPNINTLDNQFLEKLMQVIDDYVSQPDVNIDQLAQQMAMSHTLFYDKVRKLLDMSPAELLRTRRMNKAMELLKKGGLSVADVATQCGFTDARYFGTVFKKHFGILPSKVKTENN